MNNKAPFSYYGSKSRWCKIIWDRFGNVERYLEPFAGSLAILLANPNYKDCYEVASDINGYVVNFWRSVTYDPEATAFFAQSPLMQQDVTARQKVLYEWREGNKSRLTEDARYFDAEMAGWWVWGMSASIAPMYAEPTSAGRFTDSRPFIQPQNKGLGVQLQRRQFSTQATPPRPSWQKEEIYQMFEQLQNRLSEVIFMNKDWDSFTTTNVMGQVVKEKLCDVAIYLDPPYLLKDRSNNLYVGDVEGVSTNVAVNSYRWAVANGNKYKIAYSCHSGDFEVPEGWDSERLSFGGNARSDKQDLTMFSPKCLDRKQKDEDENDLLF